MLTRLVRPRLKVHSAPLFQLGSNKVGASGTVALHYNVHSTPPAPQAQFPVAAMYAQFRERYPNGSLTTTLLKYESGEFVVQAVASAGEITLGSGLAAAPDIELAEDRALERALRVAGILVQPSSAHTQSTYGMQVTLMSNHATGTAELPPNRSPNALPEPRAALDLEAEANLRSANSERLPERSNGKKPSASNRVSMPMDLSGVMAQIDVQLTRLSWDAHIGSRHLQATYSKRSRKQLTEDELLDFLNYLKAQPTPDESPF